MAREAKTVYTYIDDLTKKEVPEDEYHEITFTWGGVTYELGLSAENWAELDGYVSNYIDAARKVGRAKITFEKTKPTDLNKNERAAARQWAKDNGYEVSDRGRLSEEITKAYLAAH